MKRLVLCVLLAVLALSGIAAGPVRAQEGPQGTWLGTWPYTAPGTHHLNSFSTGGLNENLGIQFRPLVELQLTFYMWATNEYMPVLAESWGFVDDGAAYEVTLKEGALWSNGDPITSADVVNTYAIGRILNWAQFNYIDDVEAVDDLTVRYNFQEGKASLLAERLILKEHTVSSANYGELAQKALDLVATGATRESEEWTALANEINEFRPAELIASGPYTYTLDDVGEAFMTLHWQPNSLFSDTVKFGEIKIWSGETEVTTPLVLSGELAHATNVFPPATITSFEEAGIRLVTIPRGYGPALLFNFEVPHFQKKEVRQAMAHAINREQSALLTNGIFGASGTVYLSGILDSLTPTLLDQGTIDSLNRYEFDLDKAAELMEQAGYTRNADGKWADADGNTISVEYVFPADFADFSAMARDATEQLNAFGFDITERALPWQEAAQAIREGNYELSVWSWGAGSPFAFSNLRNPVLRWNAAYLAEGEKGMGNPLEIEYEGESLDLEDLINNVDNGLDRETHLANAGKIARILNDELYFIPLNEMLSVEPLNEQFISGAPADGDPIYLNPGPDHFAIWLILNGTLGPAAE
jgi:peptide/nickel transport system substrate-binding protein